MQIFLVGTVLETAKCLDNRRFNKQIIEVRQIRNAIEGNSKGWKNHPVTKMYEKYFDFLLDYELCLRLYKHGNIKSAERFSDRCEKEKPDFLKNAEWYFENMKNRLYTKNKEHYSQYFPHAVESYSNFYYVDSEWKEYKQK